MKGSSTLKSVSISSAVVLALALLAYFAWRPVSDGLTESAAQLAQSSVGIESSDPPLPDSTPLDLPRASPNGRPQSSAVAFGDARENVNQYVNISPEESMDEYKAELWSKIQADPPDLERLDEYEIDADMAYRLYMLFGNCSMVPHTDQQVDKRLDNILERAERARNRDGFLDRLEGRANEVLDIYEICLAIPLEVDRRLEAVVWMTKAVQLGHEIAEVQFYEKAMGFILRPDYFSNSPPLALQQPGLVSDFKYTARSALSRALEKGHPEAYLAKSQAVLEGLIYPKDPLLAYAYARAAELEAARFRVIVRDIGKQKAAAAQYLSEQDLAEANELARELPLSR